MFTSASRVFSATAFAIAVSASSEVLNSGMSGTRMMVRTPDLTTRSRLLIMSSFDCPHDNACFSGSICLRSYRTRSVYSRIFSRAPGSPKPEVSAQVPIPSSRHRLNSAAVTVGKENYRLPEAEKLIEEYIDNSVKLESELTEIKDTYERINKNYSALMSDFDKLNADYAKTVNENETAALELSRLNSENAELNYINENLRMRNLELETQVEKQNLEINSLHTQLDAQKNDNEQKSSEISELQKKLERIGNMIRTFF